MEIDPLADLRDALGADLCLLLQRPEAPVLDIHPLHPADTPGRRPRAFRVRYADGEARKAVRCIKPIQAVVVASLSRLLDPELFAPVLAHHGNALLMPWVEGTPLDTAGFDADDAASGGRLLALLHRVAVPAEVDVGGTTVNAYNRMLRSNLGILARRAEIGAEERQDLLALADAHAPETIAIGVIHRDLCAENIVRRPSGALCVVDVESLWIGDRDYDLARTWYRWPMSPEQRRRHFDAYTAEAGRQPSWPHFPYWAICATASSAAARRLHGGTGYAIPLERLRALRRALDGGASGRQIAVES